MTADPKCGERVYGLFDLARLAQDHKAVYHPATDHSRAWQRPAAFALQQTGEMIYRAIRDGLYVYVPPPKPPYRQRRKA